MVFAKKKNAGVFDMDAILSSKSSVIYTRWVAHPALDSVLAF